MKQKYIVSQYPRPLPLSFLKEGELLPKKRVLITESQTNTKEVSDYVKRGYVRIQEEEVKQVNVKEGIQDQEKKVNKQAQKIANNKEKNEVN